MFSASIASTCLYISLHFFRPHSQPAAILPLQCALSRLQPCDLLIPNPLSFKLIPKIARFIALNTTFSSPVLFDWSSYPSSTKRIKSLIKKSFSHFLSKIEISSPKYRYHSFFRVSKHNVFFRVWVDDRSISKLSPLIPFYYFNNRKKKERNWFFASFSIFLFLIFLLLKWTHGKMTTWRVGKLETCNNKKEKNISAI